MGVGEKYDGSKVNLEENPQRYTSFKEIFAKRSADKKNDELGTGGTVPPSATTNDRVNSTISIGALIGKVAKKIIEKFKGLFRQSNVSGEVITQQRGDVYDKAITNEQRKQREALENVPEVLNQANSLVGNIDKGINAQAKLDGIREQNDKNLDILAKVKGMQVKYAEDRKVASEAKKKAAYDRLSPEKKAEYLKWRKDLLERSHKNSVGLN